LTNPETRSGSTKFNAMDPDPQRQTCKACGRKDKFDFTVPPDIWLTVVPVHLSGLVVCLACFDEFAKRKGVDYGPHIHTLYFAGDAANLIFTRT